MEMSQIRYVLAAARHLNFTKAAADCNVTQPALTKGVKTLEDQLGTPLFYREGRRILISDFGRSMLPHLQQIADEAAAAQVLAQNFRLLEQVPVRIGVLSTIGHMRISRFLAEFDKTHPGLDLSVTETNSKALQSQLADGVIDLAFCSLDDTLQAEFRTHVLYTERYVVALPPGHVLGARDTISLEDVSGEDYVDRLACEMREMVMSRCTADGVALYARFRSESEDWVQAMVEAGIGFAFVPEFSVSLPRLQLRPLVKPKVARQVVAATAPGRKYSPALEAVMAAVKRFQWPG